MKRSTDRILTTHVGSLPRPDDLRAMILHKHLKPNWRLRSLRFASFRAAAEYAIV